MSKKILAMACVTMAFATASAQAFTYPYTENFTANNANWTNNGSAFTTYVSSGGPDGSAFITTSFNFQNTTPTSQDPVIFRAHSSTPAGPASGSAFIGNWIAGGVKEFSAYVRHNADVPLTFFSRFSQSPFPGIIYEQPNLVQPNTWTHIQFAVNAQNPYLSDEGTPYSGVFNNLARVQVGVAIDPTLVGQNRSITFDIDQATIGVPEPSTMLMTGMASIALGFSRRRAR
jgi:hypothetical protein